MLSNLIVSSYPLLLEIAIWVVLASSFVGGWIADGFLAAVAGLIGAFVFCIVIFGVFLVILDIQKSVRAIESRSNSAS